MHDKLRYMGVALVAGTVGAMVALLIAPQSGRDTRRIIKKRYRRERQALSEKSRRALEGAEEYVHDRLEDGRRAIDDVSERLVDSVHAGKKKVTRMVRSARVQAMTSRTVRRSSTHWNASAWRSDA